MQHPDDGFVAMVPSDKATRELGSKELGSKWLALGWAVLALALLSWIAYRLLSMF